MPGHNEVFEKAPWLRRDPVGIKGHARPRDLADLRKMLAASSGSDALYCELFDDFLAAKAPALNATWAAARAAHNPDYPQLEMYVPALAVQLAAFIDEVGRIKDLLDQIPKAERESAGQVAGDAAILVRYAEENGRAAAATDVRAAGLVEPEALKQQAVAYLQEFLNHTPTDAVWPGWSKYQATLATAFSGLMNAQMALKSAATPCAAALDGRDPLARHASEMVAFAEAYREFAKAVQALGAGVGEATDGLNEFWTDRTRRAILEDPERMATFRDAVWGVKQVVGLLTFMATMATAVTGIGPVIAGSVGFGLNIAIDRSAAKIESLWAKSKGSTIEEQLRYTDRQVGAEKDELGEGIERGHQVAHGGHLGADVVVQATAAAGEHAPEALKHFAEGAEPALQVAGPLLFVAGFQISMTAKVLEELRAEPKESSEAARAWMQQSITYAHENRQLQLTADSEITGFDQASGTIYATIGGKPGSLSSARNYAFVPDDYEEVAADTVLRAAQSKGWPWNYGPRPTTEVTFNWPEMTFERLVDRRYHFTNVTMTVGGGSDGRYFDAAECPFYGEHLITGIWVEEDGTFAGTFPIYVAVQTAIAITPGEFEWKEAIDLPTLAQIQTLNQQRIRVSALMRVHQEKYADAGVQNMLDLSEEELIDAYDTHRSEYEASWSMPYREWLAATR